MVSLVYFSSHSSSILPIRMCGGKGSIFATLSQILLRLSQEIIKFIPFGPFRPFQFWESSDQAISDGHNIFCVPLAPKHNMLCEFGRRRVGLQHSCCDLTLKGFRSSYVHSSIISELFPCLSSPHKSRESAYQACERPGHHPQCVLFH